MKWLNLTILQRKFWWREFRNIIKIDETTMDYVIVLLAVVGNFFLWKYPLNGLLQKIVERNTFVFDVIGMASFIFLTKITAFIAMLLFNVSTELLDGNMLTTICLTFISLLAFNYLKQQYREKRR